MKPFTLQTRVALWAAAVIVLGMVLCGGAMMAVVLHGEVAEMDEELNAEARGIFDEWNRRGGPAGFDLRSHENEVRAWLPAAENPRLVEIADSRGRVLLRSSNLAGDALAQRPVGRHFLQQDGRRWRYLGLTHEEYTLRIAADLRPILDLVRSQAIAFLIALPLLLIFVIFSARWVARRALDPVRRITASAEKVTAEQPEVGVPVPAAQDEIQRLALVLNAAFARLRQSYAQAQRFSADASHELKTPLTVLRTTIEALLESPDVSPAQRETVAALLEQTHRLASITQSLLLLSRADAGKLVLDFRPVNFSEIIEACVEDARILAEAQSIAIEAAVQPALVATADEGRISQILVNLLDNAVKYNVPGGRVAIHAQTEEQTVQVRIGNTGPGIPAEHALSLFERFFRARTDHAIPGHGLGLSLSRELARAHQGDLVLLRSDSGWTEFLLRFPLAMKPS